MLSSFTIRFGLFNILIEGLTSLGLRCMVDFLKYSQNERKRRYFFLALFVDRILNIEYIYIFFQIIKNPFSSIETLYTDCNHNLNIEYYNNLFNFEFS